MSRTLVLVYGVLCYAIFFVTFLYAVGFLGNFIVPRSIDAPPTDGPFWLALLIDLGLLGLFAVQHSVMARPTFKKWWAKWVPRYVERQTYVLFSSLALIALFIFWQPLGGVIWNVTNPIGQALLWGGFAFGWLLVLVSTFLINHFDLFGLRQSWLYFRGREITPVKFANPWPYRVVRHPLYVGWLCAFWFTPTMTLAHLVFAIATTAYILVAIQLEERNLIDYHPEYREYRKCVPMLVPFTKPRMKSAKSGTDVTAATAASGRA